MAKRSWRALLVQGVLNDPDISSICERFGTRISMEAYYTEFLIRLATTRIRFIINEAVKDDRSQEMIKKERYSFLRTKAIYQRCMEKASKKYDWRKRWL